MTMPVGGPLFLGHLGVTPASSGSKDKMSVSPPPGTASRGPTKRTRASSLGTPPH
ncbi:UNVERIFIED_CONTAM: hypothetical protein Sradi_3594700 [Sesamum radiatum]|uniref:Uncharacterized protein n=1 Tax=Sesamum radiatum TaxID=300843 RepID=A0AAW2QHA9_SESRA